MTEDSCRICGKYLGAGYLCQSCDTITIERQHNPTGVSEEFDFYFGASSGSSRKVLRELQESNVMINYATKLNRPWYGIEKLFVDPGGFSFFTKFNDYETTDINYLEYLEEHDPDLFGLRDYPCEPNILERADRTVTEHQRKTIDRHKSILSKLESYDISGQPVAVIQGWRVNDYLEHIDRMAAAGVLTRVVAIGSICRRDKEAEIREIILSVHEELPRSIDIHAFGVKGSVLKFDDVRNCLVSADSHSFEKRARWSVLEDMDAGNRTWQDSALEYLRQRRRLRQILDGCEDMNTVQETLPV